jgi:colanic acid/amylovoran biosynthesis glycosyltransferase
MKTYLGRSETFIYTQLRFQRRFRPIVLASRTENLAEFPFEPVFDLTPPISRPLRIPRRIRARVAGYRNTYDYRLVRAAREANCIALHAHFGWAACSALVARDRLDIPLVTTFYGRDVSDSLGLPYGELFDEGTLFLCEGPAMAECLVDVGCPPPRIRVVKIGLDLAQFPFVPRIRSRPLIIIQIARFVEKKGIDLSVRAFAAARRRLGPSELWIVGDGTLRPELESLASELRLDQSVKFLGMRSHADCRALVSRAHMCIQPSRTASNGDTEGGAPTVLLEMQAAGVPVVTTRHADIPTVVADTDHLAEEGDVDALAAALLRLADSSDEEWLELSRRGRDLVETEHDAARIARRLEGIYDEAMRLN